MWSTLINQSIFFPFTAYTQKNDAADVRCFRFEICKFTQPNMNVTYDFEWISLATKHQIFPARFSVYVYYIYFICKYQTGIVSVSDLLQHAHLPFLLLKCWTFISSHFKNRLLALDFHNILKKFSIESSLVSSWKLWLDQNKNNKIIPATTQ